jgi:hypothetical protein
MWWFFLGSVRSKLFWLRYALKTREEMRAALHVNCALFLTDFNENCNLSTKFATLCYPVSWKSVKRPSACFMCTDRKTDRRRESVWVLQGCERPPPKKKTSNGANVSDTYISCIAQKALTDNRAETRSASVEQHTGNDYWGMRMCSHSVSVSHYRCGMRWLAVRDFNWGIFA